MTSIENHPVIPKDVLNVFDLGYLGVEKDLHEQKSYIPNRKKKNQELLQEGIWSITKIILERE